MGVGLSPRGGRRMAGKSRVSREAHARFCERLGVKFPGATRPCLIPLYDFLAIVQRNHAQCLASARRRWGRRVSRFCLMLEQVHATRDLCRIGKPNVNSAYLVEKDSIWNSQSFPNASFNTS